LRRRCLLVLPFGFLLLSSGFAENRPRFFLSGDTILILLYGLILLVRLIRMVYKLYWDGLVSYRRPAG
jgi:hypothetical protein